MSEAQLRAHLQSLSDAQWFYYRAHQTVFFCAWLKESPDRARLALLLKEFVKRLPRIVAGFGPEWLDEPGSERFERMVFVHQVDDLAGYPDAFDIGGRDLFTRTDLPPVRVHAAVRKNGPDAQGRQTAIMFMSTHALFEGADSAALTHSELAERHTTATANSTPLLTRLAVGLMAPVQLLLGLLLGPPERKHALKSLVLDRKAVRAAARARGLSQRGFLFALVAYALNGPDGAISASKISFSHTALPGPDDRGGFFRFRVLEGKVGVQDDFEAFAKEMDQDIKAASARGPAFGDAFIDGLFAVHRRLSQLLPFLYPGRVFRFTGFYDLNLSMTPPHNLGGELADLLSGPIHAGTCHAGLNSCIFVPQPDVITLNFIMRPDLMARVERVQRLFDELAAREALSGNS